MRFAFKKFKGSKQMFYHSQNLFVCLKDLGLLGLVFPPELRLGKGSDET